MNRAEWFDEVQAVLSSAGSLVEDLYQCAEHAFTVDGGLNGLSGLASHLEELASDVDNARVRLRGVTTRMLNREQEPM